VNPDPEPVDVLIVAVKPQVFPKMADSLKAWIGPETLVISIMAGTRIRQLDRTPWYTKCVIRVMPNTPGAIGKGVSVIAKSDKVMAKQLEVAEKSAETARCCHWSGR
jgi:pyrroline-5-carboxylate reductase